MCVYRLIHTCMYNLCIHFRAFLLVWLSNRRILINELPFGVIQEDLMGYLWIFFFFFSCEICGRSKWDMKTKGIV